MIGEKIIDGHSRGFQLLVLAAVSGLLIVTAIGITAASGGGGGIGIGFQVPIGDQNATAKQQLTEQNNNQKISGKNSPGGLNGLKPSDAENIDGVSKQDIKKLSNGDISKQQLREAKKNGNLDKYKDMLGQVEKSRSMKNNGSSLTETQLSNDSFESVSANPKLDGVSNINSQYLTKTTLTEFTENGMIRGYTGETGAEQPSPVPGLPAGDTASDEDVNTMQLEESTGTIPRPSGKDITNMEITSGVNPDNYQFVKGVDGTIKITSQNKPTKLPAGTELAFKTQPATERTQPEISYTEPPETVSDVVGQKANEIVTEENADSNVAKAEATEQWLESNKDYNVDSTYSGDNPVGEFITEKEGGSSEEFAMAHAAMLREEGVPTRVATGYKKPAGNADTVRSMDKHAWTQVKNSNGEWVDIDATPNTKGDALNEIRQGNGEDTDIGLTPETIKQVSKQSQIAATEKQRQSADTEPGEKRNAGQSEQSTIRDRQSQSDSDESSGKQESNTDTEQTITTATKPYNISLGSEPVPGKTVSVIVTGDEGEKVVNAPVILNGEQKGKTGQNGRVTVSIPYTESVTITAKEPDNSLLSASTVRSGEEVARFATGRDDSVNQFDKTVTLPSEVEVQTDELLLPGDTGMITAEIRETPVKNGEVIINGEVVGRTNTEGELTITVPESSTPGGELSLRVQRGVVDSTDSIQLAEPSLSADGGIAPLPGTDGEFTVKKELNGETTPIEGVGVTVSDGSNSPIHDDELTTGENGSVTVTIPLTNSLTGVSDVGGVSAQGSISGIYYWVGGVITVAIGIITILTLGAYKNKQRVMRVMRKMSNGVKEITWKIYGWVVGVIHKKDFVIRKLVGLVEWVSLKTTALRNRVFPLRITDRLKSLLSRIFNVFTQAGEETEAETTTTATGRSAEETMSDREITALKRIKRYWSGVVKVVVGRQSGTSKTTVEIRELAVEKGLPKKYVGYVQSAFADVIYGKKPPEKRVDTAKEAVEGINENGNTDVRIEK